MLNAFPILTRELAGLAQRKGTYLLRVLYAIVLLGFFLYAKASYQSYGSANIAAQLGMGEELFLVLTQIQFVLILLVVPPIVATAITAEKESQAMELLLLLPLSDAKFLFQKWFGRLAPVLSLILVSTPLIGLSYIFGGLNVLTIVNATVHCLLGAITTGALALAISTHRQTSTRAIVDTYIWLVVLTPTCVSPLFLSSLEAHSNLAFNMIASSLFCALISLFFLLVACENYRKFAFPPLERAERYKKFKREFEPAYIAKRPLPHEQPLKWMVRAGMPLNFRYFLSLGGVIAFTLLILGWGTNINTCMGLFPLMLFILVFYHYNRIQNALRRYRTDEVLPIILSTPIEPKTVLQQFAAGQQIALYRHMPIALLFVLFGVFLHIPYQSRPPLPLHILIETALFLPSIALTHLNFVKWLGMASALFTRTALQSSLAGLLFFAATIFVPMLLLPRHSVYYIHLIRPDTIFSRISDMFFTPYLVIQDDYLPWLIIHLVCWILLTLLLRTLILRFGPRALCK